MEGQTVISGGGRKQQYMPFQPSLLCDEFRPTGTNHATVSLRLNSN